MDSGPFRSRQSGDRRGQDSHRPVQVSQSAQPKVAEGLLAPSYNDEARPVATADSQEKQPTPPSSTTKRSRKFGKKLSRSTIIAIAAVLLVVAGLFFLLNSRSAAFGIDGDKYQSILLSNDQLYFGKLTVVNKDQFKLTDIYYLQSKADEASTEESSEASSGASFKLIKFAIGDEIYDQEDEMIIASDKVLYYGNLKEDGRASQAIEQYKNSNSN